MAREIIIKIPEPSTTKSQATDKQVEFIDDLLIEVGLEMVGDQLDITALDKAQASGLIDQLTQLRDDDVYVDESEPGDQYVIRLQGFEPANTGRAASRGAHEGAAEGGGKAVWITIFILIVVFVIFTLV